MSFWFSSISPWLAFRLFRKESRDTDDESSNELPEDFELPDRFELPGGARGLGECLADGFGDLFGEGDGPLGDRARRLWESCIA